jgi:aminoglycoside phosphotransferase (APT) family kinase protein
VIPIDPHTALWVESATGVRIGRTETLVGGMSSDVHRCWFEDGSTLVVRHISDREWFEREPDLITREARALELLAGSNVPAPRLVASDPVSGLLLMTFMPGVVVTSAERLRTRSEALADTAAKIAAVGLPADHGLAAWTSWAPADPQPPQWGDRGLWNDGIGAYLSGGPPLAGAYVLLHRDFHPLNVLWNGSDVAGVVDWVNACVGHPHAEIGHCRWNLATLVDSQTADAFLASYLSLTAGDDYDWWWDLATPMSFLPGPIGTSGWEAVGRVDLTETRVVAATEQFLRAALGRL